MLEICVQMPVAQGRELMQLVTALRESGTHPNLDTVFKHIQQKLRMSIDIVENPLDWNTWGPTQH